MKAKRFVVAVIAILFALSLVLEVTPAFALPGIVRLRYPWKIDPINNTPDISSISMIYDGPLLHPQAIYFNKNTQTLQKATLVGDGLGDCGNHLAWECLGMEIGAGLGRIQDSAYRFGASGLMFSSGLVYFDPVEFTITYRKLFGTDDPVTIFDLDAFSGTISPALAYGPDGSPHILVLIDRSGYFPDKLVYILPHTGFGFGSCISDQWHGSSAWDCDIV